MREKSVSKNRITELDLLRGMAVLLMIFDHFMFDLWGLLPSIFKGYPPVTDGFWKTAYETAYSYWYWDIRELARAVVVFVFLALTGICCAFSASNIKRGLRLGIVSLLLSAVTYAVGYFIGDLNIGIAFGVLHCIAVALLLIGLLEKLRPHKLVYLIIGLLMLFIGILLGGANPKYISFYGTPFLELLGKTVLGTVSSGGDSFSLFYHGGQIMIGVFLGKLLYARKKSLIFKHYHRNFITYIGRHSLAVYIVHQVLIPVILMEVMFRSGFKLDL